MSTATAERKYDDEASSKGGISFRLISHAIWQHPIVFACILMLSASAAAGVWFFLPLPKMTAAVVFHVTSQPQSILGPTSESRIDLSSYRQTQLALIRSRRTLNDAVNQDKVKNLGIVQRAQPDPVTWLDKALTIDPRVVSEHIRLTIEGNNEEELLVLLGAVAEES